MDKHAFLRRLAQQKQNVVNEDVSILESKLETFALEINIPIPEVSITDINTPLPEAASAAPAVKAPVVAAPAVKAPAAAAPAVKEPEVAAPAAPAALEVVETKDVSVPEITINL